MLLRLVQVNQGPSLSYKETAEGPEIWGARKIQKSFDETGFAFYLGPIILPKYEGAIAPPPFPVPLVPPVFCEEKRTTKKFVGIIRSARVSKTRCLSHM